MFDRCPLLLVAAVLLAGLPLRAQEAESAVDAQPGARLQQWGERLNLTDDQREKVRPIIEEEAVKLKSIRTKYDGETSRRSRLKMFRELRGVQQDAIKRIEPLLSKQQQAEWKEIREERQDARRDEFKRHR